MTLCATARSVGYAPFAGAPPVLDYGHKAVTVMDTTYDLSGVSTTAIVIGGIFAVAVWVVFLIAYVKIISRAGYSGWWVLVMFVPILNIIMLLIFAYKEWPIQRELAELRGWANQIQRGNPQQGYGQNPGYPPAR